MRAPQGFNPAHRVTSIGFGRIIALLLGVIVVSIAGTWYFLLHTETGRNVRETIYTASRSDFPAWMIQGVTLEEPKRTAVNHLPVTTPAWPKEDVKPEPNVEPKRTVVRVHPPKKIKRARWVTLTNETLDLKEPPKGAYVLPAWTYLACSLENVLVSEIEDKFTVTLTRPVWDATGSVILIPQGQRIGAQAKTAELLLNNERIPAFALSYSLPNGEIVDLGAASIMDAAGTSGLTGEVDNHWWVLVWTSIFSGGLQGGQQVLQTQLGNDGVGPIATGITRQGSLGTQMRLGRAQDTRPTITASAGELCQILVPRAVKLPAYAALVR